MRIDGFPEDVPDDCYVAPLLGVNFVEPWVIITDEDD